MSGYIRVTNWRTYQHYKNRKPAWIKLHTDLLHPNNKLNDLPVPTRYLFDRLLLLAAEYDNAIPNRHELIANLLRIPHEHVTEGIAQLTKGQWISQTKTKRPASKRASKTLAPEVEKEIETPSPLTGKTQCAECGLSSPYHVADCSSVPRLRIVEGAA